MLGGKAAIEFFEGKPYSALIPRAAIVEQINPSDNALGLSTRETIFMLTPDEIYQLTNEGPAPLRDLEEMSRTPSDKKDIFAYILGQFAPFKGSPENLQGIINQAIVQAMPKAPLVDLSAVTVAPPK
jgi:hypothetical protein